MSFDPACTSMHPRHHYANNPPTGLLAESCPDKQVRAWHLGPALGPQSMVFTPLALHRPRWTASSVWELCKHLWVTEAPLPLRGTPGSWTCPDAINEQNPGQRPLGTGWRGWLTMLPGRLGWGRGGERTWVRVHLYLGLLLRARLSSLPSFSVLSWGFSELRGA